MENVFGGGGSGWSMEEPDWLKAAGGTTAQSGGGTPTWMQGVNNLPQNDRGIDTSYFDPNTNRYYSKGGTSGWEGDPNAYFGYDPIDGGPVTEYDQLVGKNRYLYDGAGTQTGQDLFQEHDHYKTAATYLAALGSVGLAGGALAGTGAAGGGTGAAGGAALDAASAEALAAYGGAGAAEAAQAAGIASMEAGAAGGLGTAVTGAGGGGYGSLLKSGLTTGLKSLVGGSGGGVTGGSTGSSLGSLIAGGIDAKRQGDASDKMLEWLKSRTAITDNLYAEGSPERNLMQQEMDRKDAAAGRNSQYGTRSVDLAAKIAQIKAAENTRMTTGIGKFMQGAIDQNASKYAGVAAGAGNALGGIGTQISGSLIDSMTSSDWYSSLFD